MENRAFNMDCMEAMRSMPDQCFDLAVVDPPYGIRISNNMGRRKGERPSGYKKVTWDDTPPPPEYFTELVRVSKNQIIFGANHFVSLIPAADSSCWICWDKGFSSEVSFASFELAWTSFDRPSKRVALSSAQAGRIHPTQKPVALYAWIFQHYAKQGDRILDTHLGSGSSRIAAWDAGLDFIGYEIDPEYFEAQEKRFQQHTAQMSLFGGGVSDHNIHFWENESHLRLVLTTRRRWRYKRRRNRPGYLYYISSPGGSQRIIFRRGHGPVSAGKRH